LTSDLKYRDLVTSNILSEFDCVYFRPFFSRLGHMHSFTVGPCNDKKTLNVPWWEAVWIHLQLFSQFSCLTVKFCLDGASGRGWYIAYTTSVHEHSQSNRACNIFDFDFWRSLAILFLSISVSLYHVYELMLFNAFSRLNFNNKQMKYILWMIRALYSMNVIKKLRIILIFENSLTFIITLMWHSTFRDSLHFSLHLFYLYQSTPLSLEKSVNTGINVVWYCVWLPDIIFGYSRKNINSHLCGSWKYNLPKPKDAPLLMATFYFINSKYSITNSFSYKIEYKRSNRRVHITLRMNFHLILSFTLDNSLDRTI
jgi:hypothetical protein